MQPKSWLMLKVLMNRFHAGDEDSLLEGMDQEGQQMFLTEHVKSSDVGAAVSSPEQKLGKIHYSWLTPKLANLPEGKTSLFLSLLPEALAAKFPGERVKVAPFLKQFFFQKLYPLLKMEEVTPIAYLPESPLTPLLQLKKEELVDLIDFLGVYDLAEEVKRIVDRKKLQQIYLTLTPKKHEFLRRCMHLKEKLVTPKLHLEFWDGDHEKLNKILYQRGIIRLGYALSGQPKDFIWHIAHILDVGRGTQLIKMCHKEEIPGVSASVTIQVLNIIKFFKG